MRQPHAVRRLAALVTALAAVVLTASLAVAQTDDPRASSQAKAQKLTGLSDAQAWRVAQRVLPDDGAAAPLAVAAGTPAARASAARSGTGQSGSGAPAEFLDDHTAVLPAAGGRPGRLLTSTLPLRVKDTDGKLAPVDLRLEPRGVNYLAPVNAGADVLVARNLSRPSLLRDSGVTVQPLMPRQRSVTARAADTSFFANTAPSTDVSVSAELGGLQAMWVLRSKSSPERLRLKVGAGSAIRVEKRKGGGFVVRTTSGRRLALVERGIAWDRRGRAVRVREQHSGGRLSYTVDHRQRGIAYPVVVDPVITDTYAFTTTAEGWTAGAMPNTAHTNGATNGLWLRYLKGATTFTPATTEFTLRPPGTTAVITKFTPQTPRIELASATAGTGARSCVEYGLRTAGGTLQSPTTPTSYCASTTSGTLVTGTVPAHTASYLTPVSVGAQNNAAFFRHVLPSTDATNTAQVSEAKATLPGATVELSDAVAPTLGARTLNYTPSQWQGDRTIAVTVPVSDTGLGVKRAWLDGFGGRIATRESTCTGARASRCGSFTPTFEYSTAGRAEGVHAVSVAGQDVVDNVGSASDALRIDRTSPWVGFSDGLADPPVSRTPFNITIQAADGTPGTTVDANKRAGVKSIAVEIDGQPVGVPQTQTCDHSCSMDRVITFDPAAYTHGMHVVKATVTDQAGNVEVATMPVSVDKRGPKISLTGALKDAAGSPLTRESYDVRIVAVDGNRDAEPEAGAKRIQVAYEDPTYGWREIDNIERACDTDSCTLEHAFTFVTRHYPQQPGTFYVKAWDRYDNTSVASISLTPGVPDTEVTGFSGLEEWMQYDTVETGAGSRAHINATTGNAVWNVMPMVSPGRGLSTFANVTYNSQTRKAETGFTPYDQVGEGFSLGISGLTRVNEPLDVSAADATSNARVVLVDPDGTRHQFRRRLDGRSFDPPPGVQLHLRKFSTIDPRKAWAATRPDGVTHFFDAKGFQTLIVDRNQNVLRFEYEHVPTRSGVTCPVWVAGSAVTDCRVRLTGVTDSAGVLNGKPGRTVRVAYEPGSTGRVSTLTDHGGRVLRFSYVDGKLRTLTQADGTAEERSHKFTYGWAGLSAVQDPRGAETSFVYNDGYRTRLTGAPAPDELSDRRVIRLHQRDDHVRRYAYQASTADPVRWQTDVTDARGSVWRYDLDNRGRTIGILDPRDYRSSLQWDSDNNVTRMIEAVGTGAQAVNLFGYNDNGQLRWVEDGEKNRTELEYLVGQGLHLAEAGESRDDFVSDLNQITTPKGAATGDPDDFQERFEVDARGNVTARIDAEGHRAQTEFDQYGQVTAEIDQVNNETRYEQHHPSGQAQVVIDAKRGRSEFRYDANGNILATSDPRAMPFGGLRDGEHRFQTRFTYDALDRLVKEILPKDSRAGQFITRSYDYDPNDNEQRSVDGNGAATTQVFDEMDRATTTRSPEVAHAGETGEAAEVTKREFDGEGLVTREEAPRGAEDATSSEDFSTEYQYSRTGQVEVVRRKSLDNGVSKALVTSMDYDPRGNLQAIVDPKRNERFGGDPENNADDDLKARWTFAYDKADRRVHAREDPAGKSLYTAFSYDRNGNLEWTSDPRSEIPGNTWGDYVTWFNYDQRDLLIETVKPGDRKTQYERRADGKVATIVSPRAFAENAPSDAFRTRMTYDPMGEVIERTLPKTPGGYDPQGPDKWTYQRDAVGNPVRITDARGNAFENTFLDSGDLKTTTRPGMWEADASGGKVSERDPSTIGNNGKPAELPTSEGEGDFGSVEGQEMPDVLPKAGPTELQYDNELRLTGVVERDPSAKGATTTLTRDATGRLTGLKRPVDQTAGKFIEESMGYDRNGNLALTVDGEKHASRSTFDQFDRLTERRAPGSSEDGTDVTKMTYDANGNVVAKQTPRGAQVTEHSCYDAVDQLTHAINAAGEMTITGYDPAGNPNVELKPKGVGGKESTPSDCSDDLDPAVYRPATDGSRKAQKTISKFNGNNEVTEILDGTEAEKVTRFTYDAEGNQTLVDAPGAQNTDATTSLARRKTTSVYDARGLLWKRSVGEFRGNDAATTADDEQRRTTITEYDGNGNLRRTVNPRGVASDLPKKGDGAPQQTSMGNPDDRSSSSPIRNATDQATVHEYSADNLLTSTHMPHDGTDGDQRNRQDYEHDPRGRVVAIEAPHEWTKEPRPCTDKDVDASCIQRTEFEHLDTGWIKVQRGGKGKDGSAGAANNGAVGGETQTYEYDNRGLQTLWRSASSDNKASRTMRRAYWPSGLLRRRSAQTNTTQVPGESDPPGTEPGVGSERVYDYRHSSNGQLTSMIDRGKKTGDADGDDDRIYRMAYDLADRRVATDENAYEGQPGKDTLVGYDLNGNATQREVNGELAVGTVKTDVIADGVLKAGATIGGEKTSNAFTYDDYDRETKTEITRAGADKQTYETAYWPSDDRKSRKELNGTTQRTLQEHFYANDGREWQTRRKSGPTAGTTEKTQDYRYDENGNRKQDEIGTHVFNARDQLKTWNRPAASGGGTVGYELNGSGDVTKQTDSADGSETVNTFVAGRLMSSKTTKAGTPTKTTGYKYDATGGNVTEINEASGTGTPTPTQKFGYDAFDRVASQESIAGTGSEKSSYTYDGFDRRDKTTEEFSGKPTKTANMSYVGMSNALSQRGPLNSSTANETSSFDYDSAFDSLGVSRQAPGSANANPYSTFSKDANGSIEGLAGTTGSYTARYAYDPYGKDEKSAGETSPGSGLTPEAKDQPMRFQGFYYDSGVKTYDMRARQYLPQAGRFLSQDRFESSSGDFNLVSDPLTQNRYAFAGGNPISRIEFDGHLFDDIKKAAEDVGEGVAEAGKGFGEGIAETAKTAGQAGKKLATDPKGFAKDAYATGKAIAKDPKGAGKAMIESIKSDYKGKSLGYKIGRGVSEVVGGKGLGAAAKGTARAGKSLKGAKPSGGGKPGGGGGNSGGGSSGGRCRTSNSFLGSTPVLMGDGSKRAIASLKVGDLVTASDPVTGQTSSRRVQRVIVGQGTKELVRLRIDGRTTVATDGHPFWVENRDEWVDAEDLKPGDSLREPDGGVARVDSIQVYSAVERVYNLTVEGVHTYFAGDQLVLVHNCGELPENNAPEGATHRGAMRGARRDANIPKNRDADDVVEVADRTNARGKTSVEHRFDERPGESFRGKDDNGRVTIRDDRNGHPAGRGGPRGPHLNNDANGRHYDYSGRSKSRPRRRSSRENP